MSWLSSSLHGSGWSCGVSRLWDGCPLSPVPSRLGGRCIPFFGGIRAQVGEAWQQTGAASGAAALNRADRDIEHCRCLRDWVPLHIDEHEGGTLLFREFGEGGDQLPVEVLAFGGDGSGLVRVEQRLQALGVVGERSAPGGGLAGAVQAGV